MRLATDNDVATAVSRWKVIRDVPPKIGDEIWEASFPMPIMPLSFVMTRDGEDIFSCPMSEAQS